MLERVLGYLQTLHDRDRRDWCRNWSHALIKSVLCLVRANDRPRSPIINDLLVTFFRTWCSLRGKKTRVIPLQGTTFRRLRQIPTFSFIDLFWAIYKHVLALQQFIFDWFSGSKTYLHLELRISDQSPPQTLTWNWIIRSCERQRYILSVSLR